MPKHEILLEAGHRVDSELRDSLLRYFKDSDIQKLERLGGRVVVTITAPYRHTSKKTDTSRPIDDDFLKLTLSLRDRPEQIKEMLSNLDVRQLRQLGRLAGLPLRSGETAAEIRSELMSHFRAEEFWRRIAGGRPTEP